MSRHETLRHTYDYSDQALLGFIDESTFVSLMPELFPPMKGGNASKLAQSTRIWHALKKYSALQPLCGEVEIFCTPNKYVVDSDGESVLEGRDQTYLDLDSLADVGMVGDCLVISNIGASSTQALVKLIEARQVEQVVTS